MGFGRPPSIPTSYMKVDPLFPGQMISQSQGEETLQDMRAKFIDATV